MPITRTIAAAALVIALAGCTPTASAPIVMPTPPDTPLTVTGTVIDDGSGANYCPVVLESYPPQCGGALPLDGWDWAGLDPVHEEGTVRWGVFIITGVFDGERLTVTEPPSAAESWPSPSPSHTGDLTTNELNAILDDLRDLPGVMGSGAADGYVFLEVYYDDGSVQRQLDERYGEGAVVVTSLLG